VKIAYQTHMRNPILSAHLRKMSLNH